MAGVEESPQEGAGMVERCPGWHHWRYDRESGGWVCREHGRPVPREESDGGSGDTSVPPAGRVLKEAAA